MGGANMQKQNIGNAFQSEFEKSLSQAAKKYTDMPESLLKIVDSGNATLVRAHYSDGNKSGERLLLQNKDGKLFDYRMPGNAESQGSWMTKQEWNRKLGSNFTIDSITSIGGIQESQSTVDQLQQLANTRPVKIKTAIANTPSKEQKRKTDDMAHLTLQEKAQNRLLARKIPANDQNLGAYIQSDREFESLLCRLSGMKIVGGRMAPDKAYLDSGKNILAIVDEQSKKFNLDRDTVLAIVIAESAARKGADDGTSKGLMQINSKAHEMLDYKDISSNIWKGCEILANMKRDYYSSGRKVTGGDELLSILGYNMGAGGLEKTLASKNGLPTGYLFKVYSIRKFIRETGVWGMQRGETPASITEKTKAYRQKVKGEVIDARMPYLAKEDLAASNA